MPWTRFVDVQMAFAVVFLLTGDQESDEVELSDAPQQADGAGNSEGAENPSAPAPGSGSMQPPGEETERETETLTVESTGAAPVVRSSVL